MAPDDQPQADDRTEEDAWPEAGAGQEVPDDGPEAPSSPGAGSDDEPVESDALVRLRELRERMHSQFDSLHGEIESLRKPLPDRAEGTAGATSGEGAGAPTPAPAEVPAAEPAPVDAPAAHEAPVDAAPVDAAPVGVAPLDAAPMDAGPVDEAPLDTGPVDAGPVDAGPVEDHEAAPGAYGLDLAAAGAGVDPGVFYAPPEITEPGEPARGPAVFDVEAEGWDGSIGPLAAPPSAAAPPADSTAPGIEGGAHGLPDWVFGAGQDQLPDGAPPETAPPDAAPPNRGAGEQWAGTAPWPEAAPLGDAERMFSPPGSAVRRVVVAVLVFALVVAVVILVIQLLDDGESSAQGAGAAPAAVVQQAAASSA